MGGNGERRDSGIDPEHSSLVWGHCSPGIKVVPLPAPQLRPYTPARVPASLHPLRPNTNTTSSSPPPRTLAFPKLHHPETVLAPCMSPTEPSVQQRASVFLSPKAAGLPLRRRARFQCSACRAVTQKGSRLGSSAQRSGQGKPEALHAQLRPSPMCQTSLRRYSTITCYNRRTKKSSRSSLPNPKIHGFGGGGASTQAASHCPIARAGASEIGGALQRLAESRSSLPLLSHPLICRAVEA